jgi:hypothetical protein
MEQNPILYQDRDMRVEHHPTSHEDHLLFLLSNGGEELQYIIPRGCLREFATTSRDRLELAMRCMNGDMVDEAERRGLSVDSLGLGMAKAYIENERRYQNWKSEQE